MLMPRVFVQHPVPVFLPMPKAQLKRQISGPSGPGLQTCPAITTEETGPQDPAVSQAAQVDQVPLGFTTHGDQATIKAQRWGWERGLPLLQGLSMASHGRDSGVLRTALSLPPDAPAYLPAED